MTVRFIIALLILLSSIFSLSANAADRRSFAQLTPISGTPVIFDPARITAVVALPVYEARVDASTLKLSPQIFFPLPAELSVDKGPNEKPVTQVLGIFANLMPVKETVDDIVALAGRNQFIQLTLLTGQTAWLTANAIGWVSQKYPLGENPGAGSYLGISLWPGRPTAVKEDVDTVRKLIEQAGQ